MALSLEITELLDLTLQPAFCAEKGVVLEANPAAQNRGILPGTPVEELLRSGREAYQAFQDGHLFLTVGVEDHVWDAGVRQIGSVHLFVLEHDEEQPELRALQLAATSLREPLAGVVASVDHMMHQLQSCGDEPYTAVKEDSGHAIKGLYQLQRIVGNMSDAARYRAETSGHLEMVEICGYLREIFEKAATHMARSEVRLTYELPCGSIFCLVDTQKLERAVYNLLVNAATHAPGSEITAKLLHKGDHLYLSITDHGPGIPQRLYGSVYTRYLRQTEFDGSRAGIGLGMSLICSAARAMKGTVLLQQPEEGGTRITLAFPIRQNKGLLRSDVMKIDYAGERDHALLELSELLPSTVFEI